VSVLACAAAAGSAEVGDRCETDACASGLCISRIEARGSICLGGCHTSSDCPLDMYCGSVALDGPSGSTTTIQVCEPRIHPGGALSGEPCATGWSCRDLACIGSQCADTCCSDAQCPVDFACSPVSRGANVYEMRCVPR
jgi:hypothetical protein